MTIARRTLLASGAAASLLALLPGGAAMAQSGRVGGGRILVRDDRVWLQVRFGGRGPYTFVIDTGTFVNLIRSDVARELGLREIGTRRLSGVGGPQAFTLYEAKDVTLGQVNIGAADFAGYDREKLPIHPEAAGALATSLISLHDADLDFELLEWRIYPDGRGARPGYVELPSDILHSASRPGAAPIQVELTIGEETYKLYLDTGAPGQIVLFPKAARRSGLWRDDAPFVPHRRFGVGGAGAAARLVRVPEARLGPIAFERPLVSLTDPDSRDLFADGLLGLDLIRRMNLSTEVRRGRVWAKRHDRPVPPERYGMSGMWLEEKGGKVVIAVLSPASPAADAGLRVGDMLEGGDLRQWIARLAGRPGAKIPVAYRRGGESRTAELVLREYL